MEDLSSEEKLAIVTKFLLSAPPGEFDVVLRDVKEVLNDNDLISSHAVNICRAYNTEQLLPVTPTGADYKVLLSKPGEIDATNYVDPVGGQVLTVDHLNQSVTSTRPLDGSEGHGGAADDFRAPTQAGLDNYVSEHFSDGTATVYGTNKDGVTISIVLSATKTSPRNFWSGRWRSSWEISFSPGGGKAELKGTMYVQSHYYENGNVQLNASREATASIDIGDGTATGAAIVAAIANAESDYQSAIDMSYVTMSDTAFKALRRKLPVNQQKFNWHQVASRNVAAELGKR